MSVQIEFSYTEASGGRTRAGEWFARRNLVAWGPEPMAAMGLGL
jgi:hypothetical protein